MRPSKTYVWRPPGHSVTVRLHRAVIAQLQAHARIGESRAAVLLGRKGILNGSAALVVESVELLQADIPSQLVRAKKRGKTPVGFARAEGGAAAEATELSAGDRGLLQSQMAGTSSVFVVCRPEPGVIGHLYFWHDGRIVGEEIPAAAGRAGQSHRLIPLAAVAAALFLAVFVLPWNGKRVDAVAPPASLGLTAQSDANGTVLRWNPNSPALEASSTATVVIQDGEHRHSYVLTKQQVREGSLAYAPSSSDVKFQMEAGPVQESIVAVGSKPATAVSSAVSGDVEKPVPVHRDRAHVRNAPRKGVTIAPAAASRTKHPLLTSPARFTRWLLGSRKLPG